MRGTILKNNSDDPTFVHHCQVDIMRLIINVVVRRIRTSSSFNINVPRFGQLLIEKKSASTYTSPISEEGFISRIYDSTKYYLRHTDCKM
jgi:hypothetical protein